jgi:hypothetical protein
MTESFMTDICILAFVFLPCKRESCVADIARDETAKIQFDAQMAKLAQLATVGNIYFGQGT